MFIEMILTLFLGIFIGYNIGFKIGNIRGIEITKNSFPLIYKEKSLKKGYCILCENKKRNL